MIAGIIHAVTSLHACLLLAYSIPVTCKPFRINRDYLVRMVDELSTLCPYANSCRPKMPWDNEEYVYRRLDAVTINTSIPTMKSCCSWCYCDKGCLAERRCCPEAMLERYTDGQFVQDVTFECRMNHLKLPTHNKYGYVMDGTLMTDACLQSSDTGGYNLSDASKCEEPDIRNIDEMIPVTSLLSGRVYINKYCAHCSGDGAEVTAWPPYIGLIDERLPVDLMDRYIDKNWQELYELSHTPASDLNLYFDRSSVPNNVIVCNAPVIYGCNETGLWKQYDPFYNFACNIYRSNYYHQQGSHSLIFGNVFCAICNGLYVNISICYISDIHDMTEAVYMSLLNYQETEHSAAIEGAQDGGDGVCPDTDFLDPLHNVCRPWKCPKGSYYNGETCIVTLTGFVGAYLLFLTKVGPIGANIYPSTDEVVGLSHIMESRLFSKDVYSFYADIQRIAMYNTTIANVTERSIVFVFMTHPVRNITKAKTNIEAFLEAMKNNETVSPVLNGTAVTLMMSSADNIVIHESSYIDGLTLVNIDDGSIPDTIYDYTSGLSVAKMSRVSNMDVCTLFVLHEAEYTQHERYITLLGTDVKFYSTQYDITGTDDAVTMCVDDYVDAVRKYRTSGTPTLFCNTMPMIALLLAVV